MDKTIATALRACASALEQLATALEAREQIGETDPASSSWPEFMTTRLAAQYCGFKTTGGLRKAHFDGRVSPAGRRGSVGSWTWARSELDRFMCGAPHSSAPTTEASTDAVVERATGSARRRSRRLSPEAERALQRMRDITRGR